MHALTAPSLAAIKELAGLFCDRVLRTPSALSHYGAAESWISGRLPDAAVRLTSTAEVAQAMAICHRHRVPVVAQGVMTGLAGGRTAGTGRDDAVPDTAVGHPGDRRRGNGDGRSRGDRA